MMIPLGKPEISEADVAAVARVLRSAKLATGEVVEEFETRFSGYIGKRYGIAVNSGTMALYLSIKGMGLKTVLLPALTCPDVLNAVLNAGAKPLIADVDEDTHNLDPDTLSPSILKKADGMIVTNAYGHPARLEEIRDLCLVHDITFIEDFSQSTGALYGKRKCGWFGDVSVTSFYGPKAMTTGHGGMVLTDSEEFCRKMRIARGDSRYEYSGPIIPFNLKMTDFQAALGISQLTRLDDFIKRRRNIAKQYEKALFGFSGVSTLKELVNVSHSYYKYAILLNSIDKNSFLAEMKRKGVQVGRLYDPPLNKSGIFREFGGKYPFLPVAEAAAPRTVSLPVYPSMSRETVEEVVDSLRDTICSMGEPGKCPAP